jgi:hypothetical protein
MAKIIAFLSFAILLAAGCGKIGLDPKGVLGKYIDASLQKKYEETYWCISAQDKAVKSLEEYIAEQPKENSPLAQAIANKITYEIEEVKVSGDKAKATVAVKTPDLRLIFADALGGAAMLAFGPQKDQKEIEKMLAEKYHGKEIPMSTIMQPFDLVKDPDGWKVFLNWEAEK